jgi:hypothetical protein
MKKLSGLFLLLIFTLIASCAKVPDQSKLKVSFGAMTGSANFDGGLYLFAKNTNTGQEIIKLVPPSDELSIELATGTSWVFKAIGWNGPENFEGDVFCAKQVIADLPEGDFNLSLSATHANCTLDVQPIVTSTGNYPKLSVANCYGLKPYLDAGLSIPSDAACGGGELIQGAGESFRVALNQRDESGAQSSGLHSKCVPVVSGQTDTNISLPDGVGSIHLNYKLKLFNSNDCSGPEAIYNFKNGFDNQNIAELNKGVVLKPSDRTMLLIGEEACVGDHITNVPFAAGSTSEGAYLICTVTQWNNIAIGESGACTSETSGLDPMGCEPNASYLIGKDIAFGGTNTTISTVFTGELKGGFHTLSNFNKPLFDSIQTAATDVRISDFIISGASIIETGLTSTPIGILAREFLDGGTNRIEVDGIQILNSSITDNSSSNVGEIGGLVGSIDMQTAGTGEDIFIREIHSNVDITSNSTGGQYIGGLVGEFLGSGSSNLALEFNKVGMIKLANDEYDYNDLSEAINITSPTTSHVIGGLVGAIKNAEIRMGNIVFSNISSSGNSGIGGLVGEVYPIGTNNKISNSFARMKFTPTANITIGGVGGVLGRAVMAANSTPVHINGTHGEVMIGTDAAPESTFTVDNLGGIVGYFSGTSATPGLKVKDSRSIMSTYVGGAQHGGVIGHYDYSGPNLTLVIERSIAMGTISDEMNGAISNAVANIHRGGLVGQASYIDTKMNVIEMNIKAESYVGGAYGLATESKVQELDVTAYLTAYSAYVGGVAGSMTTGGGSEPYLNSIKLNNAITLGVDTTNCTTGKCGEIFGTTDLGGGNHTIDIISLSSITDANADDLTGAKCGDQELLCDVGIEVSVLETTDSSCGSLVGPFNMADVDGNGSKCQLKFFSQLAKFAMVLDDFGVFQYYRMGSIIDPYKIENISDWNEIQSDAFLLGKSYKVVNDIDFAGAAPNLIGTSANISGDDTFKGTIFGDGVIKNAYFTTAGLYGGLINTSEEGQLGLRNFPLKFENLRMTCGSTAACGGLIGYSSNSKIFVNVKNAQIDEGGGSNSLGGLVGITKGDGNEIDSSGFAGFINSPSSINVGGLVGSNESTSGSVRITESFAKLDYIIGDAGSGSVGGIMGNAIGNGNSTIEESYVWIDPNNTHAGDDIIGSWKSGFVGKIGESNFVIRDSYVDISTATLAAGTETLATDNTSGGQAITHFGVVGAGLVNPANNTTPWFHTYQSPVSDYADLKANITAFDDEDWLTDTNGRLVLSWEIEGFDD